MNSNHNLFGIEVNIEVRTQGFYVFIYQDENDVDGTIKGVFCWTFLGAIFKGWQLARYFANHDLIDTHYDVWTCSDDGAPEDLLRSRTIEVTKTVSKFSKVKR